MIGCTRPEARYQRVMLTGLVRLNKRFAPSSKADLDSLVQQAIEFQTKNLFGFFKNTELNGMNAALSAYRGAPRVLEAKEVPYGDSFPIDRYLPATRGEPASAYVRRALERGSVRADDPALEVRFQRELILADCSASDALRKSPILLPSDPFLSLWLEDKKYRTALQFGLNHVDAASNCSSIEIASFGNPDQSWFFWNPWDPKRRCRIEGSSRTFTAQLDPISSVGKAPLLDRGFFKNPKSVKVTAIFGSLTEDPHFRSVNFSELETQLMAVSEKCLAKHPVPECLSAWRALSDARFKEKKPYEPGAGNLLVFLNYLPTLVRMDSISSVGAGSGPHEIALRISGRFLDSEMPVEVTVYYGRTSLDYGPPTSATYVSLLHQAFESADSISYYGHSGLGANVALESFERLWRERHLAPVRRNKPLWLGVYGCEGFSYFGYDLHQVFRGKTPELLLTQTTGVDTGAKFPLSQLSTLNRIFSGTPASVQQAMLRFARDRGFVVETWF
jgi:hypothetical protein